MLASQAGPAGGLRKYNDNIKRSTFLSLSTTGMRWILCLSISAAALETRVEPRAAMGGDDITSYRHTARGKSTAQFGQAQAERELHAWRRSRWLRPLPP